MSQVNLSEFDLYNPTEEHKMLRETIKQFVQEEVEPQAHDHDRDELFNLKLFKKLGELGLLGITTPEAYGGSGMDALAAIIAHEEISSSDPGFCLAYLAHAMLCVNNIAMNANEEQKKRWLPKLCSGEWVGAMAMSEPDYGTDVLGMKSQAVLKGDHYYLTGRKMWITNGTIDEKKTPCDIVLVYAATGQDAKGRSKVSTFIVEKGFEGFSVGQKIQDKTGMRGSNTAELVFENCKIPKSNLVGAEGESMLHMMKNLEAERITLAAMSLGIAKRCVYEMNKYATHRMAFGKPLRRLGQIQKYIAESYAEFMACRAYVYDTARKINLTKAGNRLDSDGVKLTASTMGKNVADRAMQVMGGYGYVAEYHVERLWRDAKLLEIGGGTIEAHQKNITMELEKSGDFLK
jgi:isovaleryl-CoA dehydrogenase